MLSSADLSSDVRVLRNTGGGSFEDVTSAAGLDVAFGPGLGVTCADFNGDGWQDIYVANDGEENQLWLNRGNGSFENTALMAGQAVLSTKNPKHSWVYKLRPGQTLPIKTFIVRSNGGPCANSMPKAPGFDDVLEVQGGNWFTLRGGRIAAPTRAKYAPGSQRHPRTGLGVTADGRVLMVTVDGRYGGSAGATLAEMGQLMRSLGAKHAFNLDGGGSTVMARFNPSARKFTVANRPSDGRQRPAIQAFVAFQVALGK